MPGFNQGEIKSAKAKALEVIKKLLAADDVDKQFEDLSGNYHGSEKFIVTWSDNYKGMPSEYKIEKCDSFYTSFSGNKCIYACASLFHEKQIKGYPSFWMALCDVGLKLCAGKEATKEFYDKYVTKYNEHVKEFNAAAEAAKAEKT